MTQNGRALVLDRGDVDRCEAGEQPFQRRRARRELTIGPVKTATAPPGYEHALDMRSDATGCPRSCSDSRLCRKRTPHRAFAQGCCIRRRKGEARSPVRCLAESLRRPGRLVRLDSQ